MDVGDNSSQYLPAPEGNNCPLSDFDAVVEVGRYPVGEELRDGNGEDQLGEQGRHWGNLVNS
ncbi:hypothetical protein D3C83_212910 [compost metagenome]